MDHHTDEFRAVIVKLCSGGSCGFPENHPGNHIASHALVSCLDRSACALCLYNSNERLARYGLTPESFSALCERSREKRAALDAQRSPFGCLNCPICHPGTDTSDGAQSEISRACLAFMNIERLFVQSKQ